MARQFTRVCAREHSYISFFSTSTKDKSSISSPSFDKYSAVLEVARVRSTGLTFVARLIPSSYRPQYSTMSQVELLSKQIGPIGYGLMGLTWRPPEKLVDQSTAFDAMSASLAQGANFWNGGELYGTPERHSGHLLKEYFNKYPDHADKVLLSIKGATKKGELMPDGSEENIRRSVEDTLTALDGTKSIDIFECARVDPKTPVEESIKALAKLVKEGKIGGIGLSEVKASTIERAAKVHPIAAVEIELSMWAPDVLKNGVAETCGKLNIPIVAYSPLARGALTGDGIKKNSDIPDSDFRKHLPKFQDDALAHNNKITDEVDKIAKKKGVTRTQIAVAWVRCLSGRSITIDQNEGGEKTIKLGLIVPIPGSTTKSRVEENCKVVDLSDAEMEELNDVVRKNTTIGGRYPEFIAHLQEG